MRALLLVLLLYTPSTYTFDALSTIHQIEQKYAIPQNVLATTLGYGCLAVSWYTLKGLAGLLKKFYIKNKNTEQLIHQSELFLAEVTQTLEPLMNCYADINQDSAHLHTVIKQLYPSLYPHALCRHHLHKIIKQLSYYYNALQYHKQSMQKRIFLLEKESSALIKTQKTYTTYYHIKNLLNALHASITLLTMISQEINDLQRYYSSY